MPNPLVMCKQDKILGRVKRDFHKEETSDLLKTIRFGAI